MLSNPPLGGIKLPPWQTLRLRLYKFNLTSSDSLLGNSKNGNTTMPSFRRMAEIKAPTNGANVVVTTSPIVSFALARSFFSTMS